MIITKTPLRISFLGGGSDIPAFYKNGPDPGVTFSTTIDKFIHVVVAKSFNEHCKVMTDGFYEGESWNAVEDARVRACMGVMNMHHDRLEIASFCDIPSYGTGMGSSSAFTVGLLDALHEMKGIKATREQIAELACHVEIDIIGDPIGKQDQYAAAITGLNSYTFTSREVTWAKANCPGLEDWCRLYYLNRVRKASVILSQQNDLLINDEKTREKVRYLSYLACTCAKHNLLIPEGIAGSMRKAWETKKSIVDGISDSEIDTACAIGAGAGASACKVLGAGGGGYILFLCHPQKGLVLDKEMRDIGLQKFDFKFWERSWKNSATT